MSSTHMKPLSAVLALVTAASIAQAGSAQRESERPQAPRLAASAENAAPRGSVGRLSGPYATATGPAKPGR